MAETHSIESKGLVAVKEHLKSAGRSVEPSQRKTFDLMVDGLPAEVKCKQAPWSKVDFIGLTDHQRAALNAGENFLLFIVCNLQGDSVPEIIEIKSEALRDAQFKVESTHYIYGTNLRLITKPEES